MNRRKRYTKGERITIRDVAAKAGVSIRTVSRAVNNIGEISESTREHVLRVVEELGYRPSAIARGLVSGKSLSVAVIIPQIIDPFFPEFVQGVEHVARSRGYSVQTNALEDTGTP
jgi:LacI family transcriptional regulator